MMKGLLIAVAVSCTTALADPGDMIRWTRWRVEAVYSRSSWDAPMDAETAARFTVHIFTITQTEKSAHAGIKLIRIDEFYADHEKWEKQTEKMNLLNPGDHVFISVAASNRKFKEAEGRADGELDLTPDFVEVESLKEPANKSPLRTPGSVTPAADAPAAPPPGAAGR